MSEVKREDLRTFQYPAGMLNLEYTLTNGQMFRWRKTASGWWDAVSGGTMISIRQPTSDDPSLDRFEYRLHSSEGAGDIAQRFFRLDVDLGPVYEQWAANDPYLGSLTSRFPGLRLVKQEAEECLLSFICSTANFIPRIMKAVSILANTWGEPIRSADGAVQTHAFPRAAVIAGLDPAQIAEKTGLEWRAANLVKVARQVAARPERWLEQLSAMPYAQARTELTRLDGVGPKIADCVCLFAMEKDQAVPVDTHVWQLTRDRYLPALRGKSLTDAGYAQILNFYQGKFDRPGWAQQYLFFDHLLESRAKRGQRQ